MDYFGLDKQFPPVEACLRLKKGSQWLDATVTMAWYLRQRDSNRAMRLADAAEAAVDNDASIAPISVDAVHGRLGLVRAEILRLRSQVEPAREQLELARRAFAASGDLLGAGDALMIEQGVAGVAGESQRRIACIESAMEHFQRAGDELRWRIGEAFRALSCTNGTDSRIDWDEAFEAAARLQHVGLDVSLAQARSWHHFLHGEIAAAMRLQIANCEKALLSGQCLASVMMYNNVGSNFRALGAYADALEWLEQGLALVRRTDWSFAACGMLSSLSDLLCRMGRYDTARAMLDEALSLTHRVHPYKCQHYAWLCNSMGDLLFEQGDNHGALQRYQEAAEVGRELDYGVHVENGLLGQAKALQRLGRPRAARAIVEEALSLSWVRGSAEPRIALFRVLADIARADSACTPR